jgi:ABC-type multidrug transport system fused ATPase/permease subunit
MVELQSGSIEIDGVDIKAVGFDTLRMRLALVPQDSTLFLGTLRDNLCVLHLLTFDHLLTIVEN